MKNLSLKQLWFLGLFLKLAFGAWLPLFSDEAYYWVWSKHLQLSYYDHPGMIAWWVYLGSWLESFAQAFRWPAIFIAHFSLIIWYELLKEHLSASRLRLWAYLAFFTPMTGLGSIIITPDLPLILFWSLSLLALERSMKRKQLKWYLLLGASLGLGFCSKYHVVLFLPFLFFWLLYKKQWREVVWKYVPLTVVVGLVFCWPVLLWNYQNDWISFKFQLDHGLGDSVWRPKYTWRYFYGQVLLLFPTVIYFATRKVKLKELTWLPVFAWGPLLFFFLTSFKGKVEGNWPSIAYPCFIALAAHSTLPSSEKWLKRTIGLWIAALFIVISQIIHPWIPIQPKMLKTYELIKYEPLEKVAESYTPFFASTFQMASKLWYETKSPTYKLYQFGRRDFFDHLEGSHPLEKTYFFAAQPWEKLPAWAREKKHKVVNKFPMTPDFILLQVEVP